MASRKLGNLFTNCKAPRVDGDTLSAVISLINSNKPISQLKHVIPQAASCRRRDMIYETSEHQLNSHRKHLLTMYLMIINCASLVRSFM